MTACPGSTLEADRWALVEEIFNRVSFTCYISRYNCSEEMANRKGFESLISKVFVTLNDNIATLISNKYVGDSLEKLRMLDDSSASWDFSHLIKRLFKEISIEELKDLRKNVTSEVKHLLAMASLTDLIENFITPVFNRDRHNTKTSALSIDIGAAEMEKKKWTALALATRMAYGKSRGFPIAMGTFLAHFSRHHGITFYRDAHFPFFITPMEELDIHLHEVLSELYSNMSNTLMQVSLFDIPSLLGSLKSENYLDNKQFGLPWIMQPAYSTLVNEDCNMEFFGKYDQQWRDYLSSEGVHPCKGDEISSCCHYWGRKLARNFKATMSVMRFAYPQTQSTQDHVQMGDLFKNWTTLQSRFTLLDPKFYKALLPNHVLNMFPSCWEGKRHEMKQGCDLFQPILTADGICHAYNSLKLSDVFKPSPYLKTFTEVYNVTLKEQVSIRNSSMSGLKSRVTFYLDGNQILRPSHYPLGGIQSKKQTSFIVSLDSVFGVFHTKGNYFEVEPGSHVEIKVTPSQTIASPGMRDMDIQKRKCKFADENENMRILKHYTQAGCYFECRLQESLAKCGCTPWNYPQIGPVDEICDLFGNICFQEHMNTAEQLDNCDCPNDCETVSFSFSENSKALRSDVNLHGSLLF